MHVCVNTKADLKNSSSMLQTSDEVDGVKVEATHDPVKMNSKPESFHFGNCPSKKRKQKLYYTIPAKSSNIH